MAGWGEFADEGPVVDPVAETFDPWADLGAATVPEHSPVTGAGEWDDVPEPVLSAPRRVAAGPPPPSSEVVAAALRAGQVLWAEVRADGVFLGSGCEVRLTETPADGYTGWRPVTVVSPATLEVAALPVPTAEPVVGAALSVGELYTAADQVDGRTAPFPLGQGPDLQGILRDAVRGVERQARARADEAARAAERQLQLAEERFIARALAAERAAADREQQAQQQIAVRDQQAEERVTAVVQQSQQAVAGWQDEAARITASAEQQRTAHAKQLRRYRARAQRLALLCSLLSAVAAAVLTAVLR
ncbi:hypothetical protein [Streptomyces sp. NPDC055056]